MTQLLTDKDGNQIGAAFQNIGIEKGPNLPDPIKLRFYVTGLPGSGKTTWACSIPNSIVIDIEDSACFCPNPTSMRFVPKTGADVERLICILEAQAGKKDNPYQHVIFDTIESLVDLMIPFYTDQYNERHKGKTVEDIREAGMEGSGWSKVNRKILTLFSRVFQAGYGWSAMGHLKEVERWDGKQTVLIHRPLINPGILGGLVRQSQYMAGIRTSVKTERVKVSTTGGASILQKKTSKSYTLDLTSPITDNIMTQMVKDRLGEMLPTTFDITGLDGWSAFAGPYNKAREKVNG